MKTLVPFLVMLSAVAPAAPAAAFELQGEWPAEPEHVTLAVEHEATSRALRLAAESAGLDLIATLPVDPPCTVRVRGAALPDVLSAILAEQPVVVTRTGRMIVVRPAPAGAAATPSAEPTQPAATPPAVPGVPFSATAPSPPTPPGPPSPPPAPAVPVPPPPPAPPVPPATSDRVTFTGDITVRQGERVRDVVTMGGDARIEGEATGDVVTMGGDIEVASTGIVHGDLVTMGGDIDVEDGGVVHGQRVQTGNGDVGVSIGVDPEAAASSVSSWFSDSIGSAARYALLFLLGLVLLGLAPERLDTLRLALVKLPTRSAATGLVGLIAAVILVVVLCITIIGIPAAVLLVLALPVAIYVGMAAAASVIGALLPSARLKDRPVLQLAAGVALLFGVSLLPFVGDIAIAIAAVVGFGTVVLTRFGKLDPSNPPPVVSAGPYR